MDLSPVLLGILFTLVLLCFVIFAKVYCYRSTTTATASTLHSCDKKHMGNINLKHDATKVSDQTNIKLLKLVKMFFKISFDKKVLDLQRLKLFFLFFLVRIIQVLDGKMARNQKN